MSEKSDFLFRRPWFGAIQHQVLWTSESAVHVGRPPALKLKNWKTEKQKKSQIPWKQGLTLHTKAYRRWYLSATTHCEYLTKRSLSVHINEIVRATNSVLYRTEMNIYELNELDSSVRSNAIGSSSTGLPYVNTLNTGAWRWCFCTMTKRLSTYLIARWWKFGWVRTSW